MVDAEDRGAAIAEELERATAPIHGRAVEDRELVDEVAICRMAEAVVGSFDRPTSSSRVRSS